MRDAGLAEGVGLVDDLGRRADQVDVLVRGRALALERRLGERDQVLVHLALAEALDRGLARLADMHDELRADLDGLGIAAGLLGFLAQRLHAGAQAVDMHAGRQPAVGPLDGAHDVVGVVAADIDRDVLLQRLGIELDVAELVVLAVEARDALLEQQVQRLQALVDDVAAIHLGVGLQRLELLAIGADAEADLDPALAEMVQRRDLLGQHHDVVAHRQHDHAGADLDRLGLRQHEGVGDQAAPRSAAAPGTRRARSSGSSCGRCPTPNRSRTSRRPGRS